ncbi:FAD-dependent oxidoreductase [Candidatus Woesearchaeota archaeon]|nr:FAD-dependent oxidoreductase [Candidatus Woesearchaeota archaeon]
MDGFESEIIEVINETHDVKTFRVKRQEGYDFVPGQFTLVSFADKPEFEGKKIPLTFSSSPTEKSFLDFSVKRIGRFTQTMHNLKAGEKLVLAEPRGKYLNYDETKDAVLIAGGSGITPFISTIRYAIAKGIKKRIVLFFSNKTESDIIYREELKEIRQQNIRIINSLSDQIPDNWSGERGRISIEMVEKYIQRPDDFSWYICGPPPMVEAMKVMLKSINVPESLWKIDTWQIPGKSG